MDSNVDFNLNVALKYYLSDPQSISTPEAHAALQELESDPSNVSESLLDPIINSIVDAVAASPDALLRPINFDSLQLLLKYASYLPSLSLSKLYDLIISGLAAETEAIRSELDIAEDQGALEYHKVLLEMYSFLFQWAIAVAEGKAAERPAAAPSVRHRSKAKKGNASLKESATQWDPTGQLLMALDIMTNVLKLKLGKLFVTTPERDTFISLLTRPVATILESEQRVKNTAIKMHSFKVLCMAVKSHGHAYAAQISIVQNLTYFEHLAEPMAELLYILADTYDYPQLADEIICELSNKEFNANDTRGPKSVSSFFIKLSELAPRIVIKQATMLAKQLDSDSYTLRCALIEVCGNMIVHLSQQEERSDNYKTQLNAFFDVLEERFLDLNPYCRCRTLQVYIKLCELPQKFPKRRQKAAELACRSLEDKSSNVRRNAIKLLGALIKTHPFTVMHGAQLNRKDWQERYEKTTQELNSLKPPDDVAAGFDMKNTDGLVDDATMVRDNRADLNQLSSEQKESMVKQMQDDAATSEAIERLTLTKRYYSEALKFIDVLHEATQLICQLLGSKNKNEVIEAMDYFEIGDAYNIEQNKLGIRRMLRLIWMKGNSDEGKGVQTHLIECYRRLFFEAPDIFNDNDAANYITRNMISLTFGATPAESTSLEQLLSTMMTKKMVSDLVISKLWQVYGIQRREISHSQRRGAIIVLGMLASANPDILLGELENMLRTGLGAHGRSDLQLAKYTCVALSRINPSGKAAKVVANNNTNASGPIDSNKGPTNLSAKALFSRLPNDHVVLYRLANIIEVSSTSPEWYGLAEQAINAIYTLAKHPDTLCSSIIRKRTKQVFGNSGSRSDSRPVSRDNQDPVTQDTTTFNRRSNATVGLAQLLFIVGHVAIKQIVHLELCEQDFKRRKQEKERMKESESTMTRPKNGADKENAGELDMIGGTTEDDFSDAMAYIRERELLFGPKSLLSLFGKLVTEICSNNTKYPDKELQASVTLCMAKLMCVSSEYCETNLPLLITIMERSTDATVRSNAVIALGDMAVCFNHLIDENTDFLYRRLADDDISVKRTCLMTLTFLILAGQIKVKGQLGEMAKCLEDDDRHITDLARMFFTELSTKDNAVYNHFVDMFSLLSAEQNLTEESFRRIIKFLLGFVEKDKHAKQLAEKLAARLNRCENERQWNDVAYALSLLPHKNDEITQIVSEGFKVVQMAEVN